MAFSDSSVGQHICVAHSLYANERECSLLPLCQTKNPRRMRRRSCSPRNILDAKTLRYTVGGKVARHGFTTENKSFCSAKLTRQHWPDNIGPPGADTRRTKESLPHAVTSVACTCWHWWPWMSNPQVKTSYVKWHHFSEAANCLLISKERQEDSLTTKAESTDFFFSLAQAKYLTPTDRELC